MSFLSFFLFYFFFSLFFSEEHLHVLCVLPYNQSPAKNKPQTHIPNKTNFILQTHKFSWQKNTKKKPKSPPPNQIIHYHINETTPRKYLAIQSPNQQQTQPMITDLTNHPTTPAIRNPHEHIRPPVTTTVTDQSIKLLQSTPTSNPSNDPPLRTTGPTTTSQPLIRERALEIFPNPQSERETLEL